MRKRSRSTNHRKEPIARRAVPATKTEGLDDRRPITFSAFTVWDVRNPIGGDVVLSVEDIARELFQSTRSIEFKAKKGELPAFRFLGCRRWWFWKSHFTKWLGRDLLTKVPA